MSTLLVAHRGASALEPEHSRGAYERAISDGSDGLECDVRLTADGVLARRRPRAARRTVGDRCRAACLAFGVRELTTDDPAALRRLLR